MSICNCEECAHNCFEKGAVRGVMDCDPDEHWCDKWNDLYLMEKEEIDWLDADEIDEIEENGCPDFEYNDYDPYGYDDYLADNWKYLKELREGDE